MKTFFCLFLASLVSQTSLSAAEYVYPTSTQGYLRDAKNSVIEIVPRLTVLEVIDEDGQDFIVKAPIGVKARIHRNLVHRAPEFSSQYSATFLSAMSDVVAAEQAAENEDYEKADSLYSKAISDLRKDIGNEHSFVGWLLASHSWVQHAAENEPAAEQLLDESLFIFESLGADEQRLAADAKNTLAVFYTDKEIHPKAQSLLADSIRIVQAERGLVHVDVAVFYQNLSTSFEADGEYVKAVQALKVALRIYEECLPESAIELALLFDAAAVTANDGEQYRAADLCVSEALQLYDQYHPEYTFERLDGRLLRGSVLQSLERYSEADKQYEELLSQIVKLDKTDADHYRKETHNRQGVVDYLAEDYRQAMGHFLAAARVTNDEEYDANDALTQQNIGNTYSQLGDEEAAADAFRHSIAIYGELGDQDGVAEVQELLANAVDVVDTSLDGVLLVSAPKGFLRTQYGQYVDSLPGLEVIGRVGDGDDAGGYVSAVNPALRISADYVRSGRMLPGYGEVDEKTFRATLKLIQSATKHLINGNLQKAYEISQQATQACEASVGADNALYAYAKIFEIGFLARLGSIQEARNQFEALDLSDFDQDKGYPISIEADVLRYTMLADPADASASITGLVAIRDVLQKHVGETHLECMQIADQIASMAFTANPPQAELAIQELAKAIEIGKSLFPENNSQVVVYQTQRALALMQNGQPEVALTELKSLLNGSSKLDGFGTLSVQATLIRILADSGQREEADRVLRKVDLAMLSSLNPVEFPASVFVYQGLAGLHLRSGEAAKALDAANVAISTARLLNRERSFQASEAYLVKAKALQKMERDSEALGELRTVLSIYQELGGGDSPQAAEIKTLMASLDASGAGNDSQPNMNSSEVVTDTAAKSGALTDSIRSLMDKQESFFDTTARNVNRSGRKK